MVFIFFWLINRGILVCLVIKWKWMFFCLVSDLNDMLIFLRIVEKLCLFVVSFILLVFSFDKFRIWLMSFNRCLVFWWVRWRFCWLAGCNLFLSIFWIGFIIRVSGVWNLWEMFVKKWDLIVLSFWNCFFFMWILLILLNML